MVSTMPDAAMVEIKPEALDYLDSIEAEKEQRERELSRDVAKREMLDWCNGWLSKAKAWREASWEESWDKYRRMSEAVYDPVLSARKLKWQSRMFVPVTPAHRETVKARLFRTILGPNPFIEVKARGTQENDQSDNIRDIVGREFEKSELKSKFDIVLDDCTTYGSGFFRTRFEEGKTEPRMVRVPQFAPVDTMDPAAVASALENGPQIMGYGYELKDVLTYRGMVLDPISIWDVFPDPQALPIEDDKPIACRYPITYGDIVAGVEKGYFFPDVVDALRDVSDSQTTPDEKETMKSDRGIQDESTPKTKYQEDRDCYELTASVPAKWLSDSDDPERLVRARIIFHNLAVLSAEPLRSYDGMGNIHKMDYMLKAGQFYGIGIPEMLKDIQPIINETVDQRLDQGNLRMTEKYGVIERLLINPKELDDDSLGGTVRFDLKAMQAAGIADVRAAFMVMPRGDVPREAFIEPQEMERYAQERTSATRATMGMSGAVRDTNDTLGGQQLNLQQAGEKFAYIGQLIELRTVKRIFMSYWKEIYLNITPDDVVAAIGPERARTFELLSPEQIDESYTYQPQGIFEMENKAMKQAMLKDLRAQFLGAAWIDDTKIFQAESKNAGIDPSTLMRSPEDTQKMIVAQDQMKQIQIAQEMQNGRMPGKAMR